MTTDKDLNAKDVEQEVVQPASPRQSASLIPVEDNMLQPIDHLQLVRFIDQMITAGAIPKHLKNREQVLCAWNYAAQLRLPPQPSLRNIAVIEGTPSLFGDLPLALVQRHEDFISYEEYTIDKDYNRISVENKNLAAEIYAGVAIFLRRGMGKAQTFAFTMGDVELAGLIARARPGMPWRSYPQVMIIRRARIMGIRALFADAISGASIAEDYGDAPDLRDVTQHNNDRVDGAKELNSLF